MKREAMKRLIKKLMKFILFFIIGSFAGFWLIVGEIILGVGLKTAAVINWYLIAALIIYVIAKISIDRNKNKLK